MFTVLKLARIRGEAGGCLLFVLLFQACYSAAPVYLSRVAAESPSRAQMLRAITVFLVLYFLPYPLTYFAALFRALWRTTARRFFYEQVYRCTHARVPEATSRTAQSSFAAVISATGQDLMADCITFTYDTALLLFSSALSVGLISIFVVHGFALAYTVSAVACGLILWRLGPWQVRMSTAHEKSYNRLVAALPQGWLANALGEREIVQHFMRLFSRRWRLNRRMAFSSMNAFRSFDLLQAVVLWVPATVVILLQLRTLNAEGMIALAIILPRLTETLLDVSNLVGNLADYLALKGRVQWLNKILEAAPSDIAGRVNVSGLRISERVDGSWRERPFSSIDNIPVMLGESGRYLVSGANGAGKTSLLLLLKMRLGHDALYLPAHAMLFPTISGVLSTGQRKLRELDRSLALAHGARRMILLDEWDANLDPANRQYISGRLDAVARTSLVIEVSHRAAQENSPGSTS